MRFDNIQHVFNRGVRKTDIFFDTSDYRRMYELLSWYLEYDYPYSLYMQRFNRSLRSGVSKDELHMLISGLNRLGEKPVDIIAYAFMPNHFHLVLSELADDALPKYVHRVSTAYAAYINRKYDLSGRLFEASYKHVNVSTEEQLRYLVSYVHKNPVKAGMVESEDEYEWSSASVYKRILLDGESQTGDELVSTDYLNDYFDYRIDMNEHRTEYDGLLLDV